MCAGVVGDYTGSMPCSSNTFDGQTIQVYDPTQLVGNNDEVVWWVAQLCSVVAGLIYTLHVSLSV